jgi:predicted small secreted protein
MKTNLLYRLKSNGRAGEKRIEPKSELTILLLLFVALALAGCETLESGSSGAGGAPSSPWPAAPTGQSASHAGQTGFAASLSGQWYHDGKPTSIRVDPDGRNLTIIDENGRRTSGVANSPYELDFARLKGSVSDGGRRISWNNGTTWTRQPHQGGSDSGQAPAQGQGISGRWYHDGKPTSVSVIGRGVTITNEAGQSSSGSLSGNDITIFGGPHGRVSDDGRRISWNNGSTWTR